MELDIIDLKKKCIHIVENFNFNNKLIDKPFYLPVHELDNYLNNEKYNVIDQLNFILSKEKRKKYINKFLLCKNKYNNKKFIIATSTLFSNDNICDFNII